VDRSAILHIVVDRSAILHIVVDRSAIQRIVVDRSAIQRLHHPQVGTRFALDRGAIHDNAPQQCSTTMIHDNDPAGEYILF
jgi:hypothetical protein